MLNKLKDKVVSLIKAIPHHCAKSALAGFVAGSVLQVYLPFIAHFSAIVIIFVLLLAVAKLKRRV
jgi:hypothetical protein